MRINKNDNICNIYIIKIRNFLRSYNYGFSRSFSIENLQKHFNLNQEETSALLTELIKRNYFAKNTKNDIIIKGDYIIDNNGFALCAAKLIAPINKEKADKIFNEFMQRVEEINENEYYLVKVKRTYVFGSYIDKKRDDFGDIDIYYELERKISDWEAYDKLRKQRINELAERGRFLSTFNDELQYPETEVILKMKNRCRHLSLQPLNYDLLKLYKHKMIYPKTKLSS